MFTIRFSLAKVIFPIAGLLALAGFASPRTANAQVIRFEVGSLTALPYTESGFNFTSQNLQSAVFAPNSSYFTGSDNSGFLGFQGANTVTLTKVGGGAFSLDSLLLGPTAIGTGTANITVAGTFIGGGSVSQTFTGLTTATLQNIGYSNVSSVTFTSNTDAGIDNVTLNGAGGAVGAPEPGSLPLLGMGLVTSAGMVGMVKRRKAKNKQAA